MKNQNENIRVELGDICTSKVDYVVNPANEWLRNGAGAAGALNKLTKGVWQRACTEYIEMEGPLSQPDGDTHVWERQDGSLPFRFILSTVGPRNQGQPMSEVADDLRWTMRCLLKLVQPGESIAIPAISSGIFGCPVDVVAESLYSSALKYGTGQKIIFRNWDKPTCEVFSRVTGIPYEEVP